MARLRVATRRFAEESKMLSRPREGLLLALITLAGLAASGVAPYDYPTWVLEVSPVFLGLALVVVFRRRFPLTRLTWRLMTLHGLILVLGGHYTYARVPLGYWLQDVLDFSRNPYDRIGHIAQGFVPAILIREILLRTSPLVRGGWLFFLVTATALAVSATYELLEWLTAVLFGEGAESFLGTQGDPWDTQWDMFLALCGALAAQFLLSRRHDLELRALGDAADEAPPSAP